MNSAPSSLIEAQTYFRQIASEIAQNYAVRKPKNSDQVTPPQLIEALEQFLTVSIKLDQEEGPTGPILQEDVTELGGYGLSLIVDLAAWAGQLDLKKERADIEGLSILVADWIIRHEGKLYVLEPIVNSLALSANKLSEPRALEKMAEYMTRVLEASADTVKQDLEKANPGRPWRVLHLNRGIVATRSHNTALMQKIFDDLARNLPEDAPQFFEEGMQQMDALNYPAHVKQVMNQYFTTWANHTLH